MGEGGAGEACKESVKVEFLMCQETQIILSKTEKHCNLGLPMVA